MPDALCSVLSGYPRVVFDLDGTLYDARDYEHPALAEVAAMLRQRSGLALAGLDAELWRARDADRHATGLFDRMLAQQGLPVAWAGDCVRVFRDHAADALAACPSLVGCLNRLRAANVRLALVSNGRPEVQTRKLARLGLQTFFDRCVFCHPGRPEELKPQPWAWQQLGDWCIRGDMVYVGDDDVDAGFARAGEVDFIHFSFRNPAYAD